VEQAVLLARELLPDATRIGYITGSGANSDSNIQEMSLLAEPLGLSVIARKTGPAAEKRPAYEALVAEGVDAIILSGGAQFLAALPELVEAEHAAGVPTIHAAASAVSVGGLISIGDDQITPMRASAHLVARILKGESPGEIPVAGEAGPLLRVNLATAEKVGLTIPQSILDKATDVVE
jgi:putative ABC transport system substrate-binding protein